MPRYFFNVHDGKDIKDHEGTECAGLDEARAEAITTSGEILRDSGGAFWSGDAWRMEVTDEGGHIVFTLNFSAS